SLPPAVIGLYRDFGFLTGLRGRLSVRDSYFDLPQQIHNLLRLVPPDAHDRSSQMKFSLTSPGTKITSQVSCRVNQPQQPNYFFFELAMAGRLTCLSNSACSEGEQIISRRSKSAGCNRRGNLLRAFQGFAYIFGSMIVSVSSRMS